MRRLATLCGLPIVVVLALATCTAEPLIPSSELAANGAALLVSRTMTTLELSPDTVRIGLSGTQVFTVKASYSDGSTVTDPSFFAWTAPGGWISNGSYASKGIPGTYKIIARVAGGLADSSIVIIGTVAPPPPAVPTLTFASLKTKFVVGDSSTLSWTSANTTACTATGGWTGSKTLSGSQIVKPTTTTSYALTCSGSGGTTAQSVTDTVTTVAPPPAVPTLTFASNKPALVAGDSVTLTWASSNSSSCTATGGWTGAVTITGSTVVKPTVTTTYTLTCTGAGGNVAKSVTATVTPAPPVLLPTLSLATSKTTFVVGDSAALTWASANSTACTATGGWTGTKTLSGSLVVRPTVTTTYSLTCTGTGGSVSKSVTETVTPVNPLPTLSFASNKASFIAGDSATLAWTSANSTSCTASGGWTGAKAVSGSAVVKPASTTTYTLTCAGTAGSITKSVTETVTPVTTPPPSGGTLPNQPAGLNVLVDEPWNTRTPSGWQGPCSGGCSSHVAVVADATAPRSPSNVLQFTYQGVTGAGDGVGQIVKTWPGVKTLYLAFWFKHSTNWRNCDSGINKMVYFGNAAQNDNIINFEGGSVTVYQQNGINDHGRMGTGAPAAKGQWHFFEMVATIDGRLAQWVDGRSNGDRNDLRWQSSAFTAVDVDPIWGGGCTGSTAAGQTFEIDHLYISGK
jgi:hypothetical protein